MRALVKSKSSQYRKSLSVPFRMYFGVALIIGGMATIIINYVLKN